MIGGVYIQLKGFVMKDRFDFEQQLMECWHVVDDLDTLCEGVLEHDMPPDDISNVLLGMKTLYDLKFQKMFNTFEELVRTRKIK